MKERIKMYIKDAGGERVQLETLIAFFTRSKKDYKKIDKNLRELVSEGAICYESADDWRGVPSIAYYWNK